MEVPELFALLRTSPSGLTSAEAEERLAQYGRNEVSYEKRHDWSWRLLVAIRNPLVILLTALSAVSFVTGDLRPGSVMVLMVILGVGLRFIQEFRADTAAAKLKAMISVTATVIRDGEPKDITFNQLVPGDVIVLSAGDMVPGDVRLILPKDVL
jgi:Cation transport ATPase